MARYNVSVRVPKRAAKDAVAVPREFGPRADKAIPLLLAQIAQANGAQTDLTKSSNPKEAFGDAKMPMDLLPDTATVQFNLAFLEGALKYGQYNWRVAGVKVSTYVRAARRHLSKFWNGKDVDPVTLVHELASVGACCAIMLDAIACGKLTDDRPPHADMERALADAAKVAAHLKQLFKDHSPPQYTEREHGTRAALVAPRTPPAFVGTGICPDVPAGTLAPARKAKRWNDMTKAEKRAFRAGKLPRLVT